MTSVWVLGGYRSDFAHNVRREGTGRCSQLRDTGVTAERYLGTAAWAGHQGAAR